MTTVFVGLSGGVDSAVSAALLKQRGYDVVGAFIKIWSPEFIECTWKEDRLDAMRVCAALQIPFLEVDLSEEYKGEVVLDMLTNYANGITPNPDVLCNRSIKFGHFKKWALSRGADMIATGHYARVREHGDGPFELLRGSDPNKDQSYFLHRLGQSDLAKVLFPIGEFEKSRVRAMAATFGLPNAARRDSQGLCFVGDVSMKEFLARFIELQSGNVVDRNGSVIGTHDGAALYTIGERHGFSTSGPQAHYIVDIDARNNVIVVSPNRADGARPSAGIRDLHWIGSTPEESRSFEAQARYREKPFEVTLSSDDFANFSEPRIAAPGQSLVFYRNDVCLGGAVIA